MRLTGKLYLPNSDHMVKSGVNKHIMMIKFCNGMAAGQALSKADLARRVGVDRSYVTKLEQGKMQPSGEMMFRIARYLGKPLEAVFQHAPALKASPSFSGPK